MSGSMSASLVTLTAACAFSVTTLVVLYRHLKHYSSKRLDDNKSHGAKISISGKNSYDLSDRAYSYLNLIGNTPMVKLQKLSAVIGCSIYVKMESMNPGGTGKDRAAKEMVLQALADRQGQSDESKPDCEAVDIVEGTSGSTGIALAGICNAIGLMLHVVMPDDQAEEKRRILEQYGANVYIVPSCSISNENHYVNQARSLAQRIGGIHLHQFENLANFKVHMAETGPEIWTQMNGAIDAFVMSSGTGGTIAGVSRFLKSKRPDVEVVLADPIGSSLHQYIKHGVCYTSQQSERKLRKHRYDSIVEGVGLDRLTKNFQNALIDDSEQVADQEIMDMAHWMLREEGIFIGSSSALNLVAACRTAKRLKRANRLKHGNIVTIICDSGQRHLSRFWNKEYIGKYGIQYPEEEYTPKCLKQEDAAER